jgi:hypothetical protein
MPFPGNAGQNLTLTWLQVHRSDTERPLEYRGERNHRRLQL